MADLIANAPLRTLGEPTLQKFTLDTSAARTVYKGQPLIVDQSVDTSHAVQYVDAVVVDATDVFLGIASEGKTVASGDAETTEVSAYVEPTILGFKSAVFNDYADLGKTVYMSDSGTLSTTAADNPQIGKLHSVKDGYAFVALESPKICTGA